MLYIMLSVFAINQIYLLILVYFGFSFALTAIFGETDYKLFFNGLIALVIYHLSDLCMKIYVATV